MIVRNPLFNISRIGVLGALLVSQWSVSSPAIAALELGLSSQNFIGQGTSGRARSFTSFDLGIDAKSVDEIVETRLFAKGMMAFNDPDFRFIELPEFYIGTSRDLTGPVKFNIGRKIENWSTLDEQWGFGIWQPRFRWDYLQPQTVGLFGAQTSYRDQELYLVAFASPFYVPDRSAPLDVSDGRVQSISPWVLNPPYSVKAAGKDTQIRYSAEIPELSDIVKQTNYSFLARVGRNRGFYGQASYAYKPMNQLLMSYDAFLNANSITADVKLYPRVSYHDVMGLESGYVSKEWDVNLSYLYDRPIDQDLPLGETYQLVTAAHSISPTIQYHIGGRRRGAGKFSFSYLRVFMNDLPDEGQFANGSSNFDSRYPFKNAILTGLKLPRWRNVTADFRLLYDIKNPGTIVSTVFEYNAVQNLTVFLATDVLTSFKEETPDVGTNFIYRYRANDRISGGVSYVF